MLLNKVRLADGLGSPEGKPKWASRPRGAAQCHPGVLVLLLGATCMACGFAAGHFYAAQVGSQAGVASLQLGRLLQAFSGTPAAVCHNTCFKANDGVCDEGRGNFTVLHAELKLMNHSPVLCDLGTDCNDCGPWTPTVPPAWEGGKGGEPPIALLRRRLVEVRVKPIAVEIDGKSLFRFAYTDPSKDLDVSRFMDTKGAVELSITRVFYHVLKGRCVRPDGSRALFVDVGANFGWFSIFAASQGCRVIAFEPVPHFRAFLEYNVHVNNFGHLVEIRDVVVSNQGGTKMNMVVPSAGIWGTAGIDGLNIDTSIGGATESLSVPSVTLDGAIKEDVLLLKVDVEGWEWSVFAGAQQLLTNFNVENIVMEYSPGVAERTFRYKEMVATVQMLMDLIGKGYRIAHLLERDGEPDTLDRPLPKYEEVLLQNLKHDMRDVELVKDHKLGCPLPEELRTCGGSVPEDLSPRSLRSMFSHNTNLWLSKHPTLQPLEGHVGFVKLSDPPDTYMVKHKIGTGLYGMGFRRCSHIDPKWQVRHRCPCANKAVCGAEEDLVLRLAREGKIPTNYILQ